MTNKFISIFGCIWLTLGVAFGQIASEDVIRCATDERAEMRERRNPKIALDRAKLEQQIQDHLQSRQGGRRSADELILIPVVVHVVHDQPESSIGGPDNPNITDEQIHSQIEALNEDYRRMPGTRGFNDSPVGADAMIQFYLAQYDPDGRESTGITRTRYSRKTSFNPFSDDLLLANIVNWPSDQYLNIWVCRLTDSYLGIAQFPSTDQVPGLDTGNDPNNLTDGAIIDFRYFGRQTGAISSRVYNLGRTTTHELGHWLGLIHTWGDSFCGTDYCADTPPTEGPNRTTVCQEKFSNCNGVRTRNMIENYLDYSPDSCMNIFTKDQVDRMHAVLELSPRRARLVESAKAGRLDPADRLTVTLYPNPVPAQNTLTVDVRFSGFKNFTYAIRDLTGRQLFSNSFINVFSRRLSLSVQLMPPGMYLFSVETDNETLVKRFIVR